MIATDLLTQPLASAEFLALDTETNGLARERCELTEVGAVLIGGGELHDRWSSLVGVSEPLGRGIQRFTGITQAMVDEAPPPAHVLPQLAEQLEGRILVAHSARGRDDRPDLSSLPKDPGVYIFRDADGRPLYVGKSICLRTRARAHFTQPVAWTGQAEHVDYQPTESELGALLLENRLIKRLRPPGNVNLKKSADGYVYLRCRLDIPYPILEVAHEPAAGHAVCVGPVRGRAAAAELVEQINSLFGLRHCGRGMPTRQWPSAYGQMGRCLSPCLGDLDPNLYRDRLEEALRLFVDERDGGHALLRHVDRQMRG